MLDHHVFMLVLSRQIICWLPVPASWICCDISKFVRCIYPLACPNMHFFLINDFLMKLVSVLMRQRLLKKKNMGYQSLDQIPLNDHGKLIIQQTSLLPLEEQRLNADCVGHQTNGGIFPVIPADSILGIAFICCTCRSRLLR